MPPSKKDNDLDDVEMAKLVEPDELQKSERGEDVDCQSKSKWSLKASGGAKALSSCGLYSFCSVSMILTNKSLASR
jgi:hypothetical protein